MAEYIGPSGTIEAYQLTEPRGIGKDGEWWLTPIAPNTQVLPDALPGQQVCADVYFKSTFKQRYPKPVGAEREDPKPPEPKRCA